MWRNEERSHSKKKLYIKQQEFTYKVMVNEQAGSLNIIHHLYTNKASHFTVGFSCFDRFKTSINNHKAMPSRVATKTQKFIRVVAKSEFFVKTSQPLIGKINLTFPFFKTKPKLGDSIFKAAFESSCSFSAILKEKEIIYRFGCWRLLFLKWTTQTNNILKIMLENFKNYYYGNLS